MKEFPAILINGETFLINRNHELVSQSKGLMNREQSTNIRYIGFPPDAPIEIGDWLINDSGDRFYVYDKETQSSFGVPVQLKCFIKTKAEYNSRQNTGSITYNIGTATGSIIGNQSNFTFNYESNIQQLRDQLANSDSPDKAELEQLVTLLEMVINDQAPPQKGLFSKFASALERNGWFAPQVAATLLNWLTTQV